MAKCNLTGNQIALTIANEALVPDGKLYIWDTEKDRLSNFDFLNKINDTVDADRKEAKDKSSDRNGFVRRYVLKSKNFLIKIFFCQTT